MMQTILLMLSCVFQLISLALDGVTGGVQDKLRGEHRPNAYRMMLFMNLWSLVYLFAGEL